MPSNLRINPRIYYTEGTFSGRPQHFHAHCEILFILEGSLTLEVQGVRRALGEGDACFIFPNVVHGYEGGNGSERHILLNFAPEYVGGLTETLLSSRPENCVVKGSDVPELSYYIKAACKTYVSSPAAESFGEEKAKHAALSDRIASEFIRGSTVAVCALLLSRLDLEKVHGQSMRTMQTLTKYCLENYTKKLTLGGVSEELHISRHYISHLFAQEFKTGFLEYINSLRVSRAKELLRSGDMKISEVAALCGFESPRTFGRVFMAHTGMTPRDYRGMRG